MKTPKLNLLCTMLWLLCLLLPFGAFAQRSATQATYWVFLTDKGPNPRLALSERAIHRRERMHIVPDSLDYAVNQRYIEGIRKVGGTQARVLGASRWLNAVIWHGPADALNKLEALPYVRRMAPMQRHKMLNAAETAPQEVAAPQEIIRPWNFRQLTITNTHRLHQMGFTGEGVVLAVLDDGYNKVNEVDAFERMREQNLVLSVYDFRQENEDVYTVGGHGTQVLSCIVGHQKNELYGAAPDVSLHLLRSEYAPTETMVEEYHWVLAAEYADSAGADVIQSSLGYTVFDDPAENHSYSDMDGDGTVITRAADLAASRGILVVISAGNSGDEDWRYISAPADGDSVIAVGAVKNTTFLARFSSRGPTADGRIKPDVLAQGYRTTVASSSGRIVQSNGTSFAAPLISGMACCLRQAFPEVSSYDLFRAILQSGDQFEHPENAYGFGLADATRAYAYLEVAEEGELAGGKSVELHFPEATNQMLLSVGAGYFGKELDIVYRDRKDRILQVETFRPFPQHGMFNTHLPHWLERIPSARELQVYVGKVKPKRKPKYSFRIRN